MATNKIDGRHRVITPEQRQHLTRLRVAQNRFNRSRAERESASFYRAKVVTDAREAGLSWPAIAEVLNVSVPTAIKIIDR